MGCTGITFVLVVLFNIALAQDYLYDDNEDYPVGEHYTDGLIDFNAQNDFEYHDSPRNTASNNGKVSKRM